VEIVSYNLNGIRSAISKGLIDWIKETDYDIYLFQEIKADEDSIPKLFFEELGYHQYWFPAQKKGYSGVGAISKRPFDRVVRGMGIPSHDEEGRLLRMDLGDLTLINSYFPSGSSGELRQAVKMVYLDDFLTYISALKQERPNIIVSGDYNICHQKIDIHDPVGNKNSSGFLPEEREWMSKFFDSGFVDTLRHFNQEPHQYSWWSFRANARANNKGWRIDYHAATKPLENALRDAAIFPQARHSDHCPVYVKISEKELAMT
jgi:exodeoxyribonuclease III